MRKLFLFIALGMFALFAWNCQKTYTVAPLNPASFTATPTFTNTPCGYPGNTCTPTFTSSPTATGMPTNTYTPTFTPTYTATSTPSILPTPQGILGTINQTGVPNIFFIKDTNPYVLGYKVYESTNGTSYSCAATFSNGSLPAGSLVSIFDSGAGTSFNLYYYVTEYGSLPDSPPSPVVHAVSGVRTINTLVVTATNSTTPNISISGTVSGAVKRVWAVYDSTGTINQWGWGEGAAVLTNVNYGFNGYGITYVPALPLTSGATYVATVLSFNNENWNIDASVVGFTPP